MNEITNYDRTPVGMLDTLHTMTGAEFECKDGIVTEVANSRRHRPEPPTGKGFGRFCEAEKRIIRNMIADADEERIMYIVRQIPSEYLYTEAQRREAECKAVLAIVRQAIGV